MRHGFKKLTAILLAALMLLAVLPASAWGTEQYSDPVMPGIDLASIIDPNTPVITYVFKKGDQEISRQTVKNGDTLVEPEVTTGANEKFTGWEPAVTFGTVSGVEKTETITVTAQIEKVYYVFFKDKDGRVIATKEGKTGDAISGFDEVTQTALSVIPLASDEGITGWKDENETVVESVTLADRDVNLTAVVEKGYWITFESNGGSYIAPHFYTSGQEASEPDAPAKPGFTFAGWYTDEALTAAANFATISASTTVYAKWTPANTKYTVIHWQENADNDDYSYKESETLYGNSGATTSATAKSYEGFTAQTIEQKTIAGDGSTIVNVYYKRNVYQVKFYVKSGRNYSENTSLRITAKYGENIKTKWPGGAWYVNSNHDGWGGDSTAQAGLEMMPLNGKNFYDRVADGNNPTNYYVEVLPGETIDETTGGISYKLDHTDYWPNGWTVTDEDKYSITGFTYKTGTANGKKLDGAKFYYTRNSYNVVYYNGDTVAHEEAYKYEADISSAGTAYTPTTPPAGKEGFIFVGWYADPEGTKAYDFTGKTMPAENIIVYAKWVPPVYTVTVYDADKATVLETFANVPKGDKISEDSMPVDKVTKPNGSEFLGWVNMDDEKPFNFDTQITKNYSLYAKVGSKEGYTIVYNANGGNGTAPTDSTAYAVGSSAVVQPKGDMTAPDDPAKAYFLGWAKTENATEPEYQPGASMEIVAADANENRVITLYAVWGPKPATTTLTYNANYEGADPETVTHAISDGTETGTTTVLPNNATVTLYGEDTFNRQGYKLIGWNTDKEAAENGTVEYDLGASVIVDNDLKEGEANILYGVWKKATIDVTIAKLVTGNMGERDRFFTIIVSSSIPMGSGNGYTLSEDKKTATFSLSHNTSGTLSAVPIGAELTITEENAGDYTLSVYVNDNKLNGVSYTIPNDASTVSIRVENERNGYPETGVLLDSLPYILILAVVIAIGAYVIIRKRRNRDDD